MHLLVARSRSSAKFKVKYKGYISQKMAISGAFVFHKHILFFSCLIECLFMETKDIMGKSLFAHVKVNTSCMFPPKWSSLACGISFERNDLFLTRVLHLCHAVQDLNDLKTQQLETLL